MLRKAISSHLHWPKQVKLCLFALRSIPNQSTRYSPFELLYGRGMNSPIDLVAGEWEEHPTTTVNIPRWMEQVCQRLDVIRASARENGLEVIAKSKAHYDRNTKTRDIPEGSGTQRHGTSRKDPRFSSEHLAWLEAGGSVVGSLRGSSYSQSSQYRDRSTRQRLQEETSCAYQPCQAVQPTGMQSAPCDGCSRGPR